MPPPCVPERQQFWDAEQGHATARAPHVPFEPLSEPEWLVIAWDGPTPRWQSRSVSPPTVGDVMAICCRLQPWEVRLTPGLANVRLPGDWVFRDGSTIDERVAALAPIVSAAVGHPVRFERRTVDLRVVAVTGRYAFTPLPGYPDDGVVHIGQPDRGRAARPMNTTLGDLIARVGRLLQTRVIDETADAGRRVRIAEQYPIYDADAVAGAVQSQTGLTFAARQEPTAVWQAVEGDEPLKR